MKREKYYQPGPDAVAAKDIPYPTLDLTDFDLLRDKLGITAAELKHFGAELDPQGRVSVAGNHFGLAITAAGAAVAERLVISPRPMVWRFALLMELKLREHDARKGKQGWKQDEADALLNRAAEELVELRGAVERGWVKREVSPRERFWHFDPGLAQRTNIVNEAADVANMVAMVADVCGLEEVLQERLRPLPVGVCSGLLSNESCGKPTIPGGRWCEGCRDEFRSDPEAYK